MSSFRLHQIPKRIYRLLPVIYEIIKPYRATFGLGFLCMIINRASALVIPASVKHVIDKVIGQQQTYLFRPIMLVVFAALVVQGLSSLGFAQFHGKASQRLIASLRCRVQAHIGMLPVSFFDSVKIGALIPRIMTDVEGIRNFMAAGLIDFVGSVITALFAFGILYQAHAQMACLALGLILAYVFVVRKTISLMRPRIKERVIINSEIIGRLTESLGGIRVIKGYHAESSEQAVFANGIQRLLRNVNRTLNIVVFSELTTVLFIGSASTLVLYLGVTRILLNELSLGGFVTFTIFLPLLTAPILTLTGIGTNLVEAIAALDRTHEILSEKTETQEPRRTETIPRVRGEIAFENVTFAYEQGKPILHDLSFRCRAGTVTAIVGSSGAGKSTILALIAGFYAPDEGLVRIDDIDLSRVKIESYRTQLGIVSQETFLFDGTIRENVSFARPSATEPEILEACRMAHVHEFAERFEAKYDTIIGERGVKLSGGQRQRVSIARAILANPRILLLDEATSSLDSESESFIQESIKLMMERCTVLIVAHRLSTIQRADQIIVLNDGSIVERGTHDTLIAARSLYYDLYTKQYSSEMTGKAIQSAADR
jgi:ABC-type multidrug transport system fused ATPase/permease subunit